MVDIDFSKIDKKWQEKWESEKVFEVEDSGSDKFYVLEMYPYPSGSGLHMGHAFNYVIGDVLARYKTLKGFNVLHPMGYDSFGLPAENAAIKAGSPPREFTEEAIENFERQQKALGLSYDWSRKLMSHDPNYYKWNQWIFLKMYEKGLVYKRKAKVNWCLKCNSVLANEQVHNGRCWRHSDTEVIIRDLDQWFLKITDYADELYEDIEKLNWPERIKAMQRNWIGKSHGVEIEFDVEGEKWKVFTTRPDTIYGVTFMVVSAQHPELMDLVKDEQKKKVNDFLRKIKISDKDNADLDKEGVFTGSYATNPVTGDKIPIYAGNFVVADYGSGMVMAVPAHDSRDFEFAKKYKIPIKVVIEPGEHGFSGERMSCAFTGDGVLINSEKFNGWNNRDAMDEIVKFLEAKGVGKKTVQFKLRDWLISRQRYWGTPIPAVYDKNGNVDVVGEDELPVMLPDDVKFGEGNPLKTSESFRSFEKDGHTFFRETDTMDTFFDSSWYYLRFCDSKNSDVIFDKDKVKYWMPVDFYTGGAEHACMHLIYARFFTKFLRDIGLVEIDEPFGKLFNQGMIHGEDGHVMSKSRGNVVDPMEIIEKYGADSLRMFLISNAAPDKDSAWDGAGVESVWKLLQKIYGFDFKKGKSSKKMEHKINLFVKGVGEDIENLKYNSAVVKIRQFFDFVEGEEEISIDDFKRFVKVLSVFCPHICEEIWLKIGGEGFVSKSAWPEVDESKIDESIEKEEKIVGGVIEDVKHILNLIDKKVEKVYVYSVPSDVEIYESAGLKEKIGKEVVVYAVNDSKRYDPEGKARKAKPGKPGIYLE